jgi:3-oxoacyl-[acyl-carrier-protein] synthase II
MTAAACHMTTQPNPKVGAVKAMEIALRSSGITFGEVGCLNMHATSTPVGDLFAIGVLQSLIGNEKNTIQISATKSMTGLLLRAGGGIEAIISLLAIKDQVIPSAINTQPTGPCDSEIRRSATYCLHLFHLTLLASCFHYECLRVALILIEESRRC